ncbi:Transmembrane protein 43-like [Scleropages formosus]|uniref:Transmembrane protein 43-like n=1 Tax=Scleropages formosus TaxID=113540 RepID=A0A0P7TRP3_SCLFO|nr:Transmembrane protein 43-like [Scleropages formosus]
MAATTTFGPRREERHAHSENRATPGFLERLSETVGGALLGVGLLAVSFYVLFTNEGRAQRTAASLDEALSQVVLLHPPFVPELQTNNQLVHLSAPLRTTQPLFDPNYQVAVAAVKLRREVEMYQWVEYQDSRDYQEDGETRSETTYTYNTEWRSEVINSRNFDKEIGHLNPSAMAVESVTVVAPEVWVGGFSLSKGLLEKINNFQRLSLGSFPAAASDPFLTVHEDYFYHATNPRRPEVGDVRVSFSYAGLSGEGSYPGPAQVVTVVAMQRDNQLVSFRSTSGEQIEILYLEELSAQEVFEKEHRMNSMKTWALRAAGWALMFLGISLATRIVYTLGGNRRRAHAHALKIRTKLLQMDWLPVVRDVVNVGLKLFALCVSSSLALLTIAAGWIFYRPLVAGALGALALVPFLVTRSRSHSPPKKHE